MVIECVIDSWLLLRDICCRVQKAKLAEKVTVDSKDLK